jgi:phytoene dehydrogenase-like protein
MAERGKQESGESLNIVRKSIYSKAKMSLLIAGTTLFLAPNRPIPLATMGDRDPKRDRYDAVIIGSGPNGLAAAIRLAQEGWSTLVVEAAETPGGGARTAELTIPGFHHDICSAVHPMGLASPFLKSLPLAEHGLEWIHSEIPLAHPLEGGKAAVMHRSIEATSESLGVDAKRYSKFYEPLVVDAPQLFKQLLGPFRIPAAPVGMARFGINALRPATWLAKTKFRGEAARALFAGHAAHSVMPLDASCTSAIGMMLSLAGHSVGWPIAKGGTANLTNALVAHLKSLGGELLCSNRVTSIEALPPARAYLFDTSPSALASIARDRLPANYLRRLLKYRHGAGLFKIDWALDDPIPWISAEARRAGTVHVGGTLEEIAEAEALACSNRGHPQRPFVLVAQPTVSDPSRAPAGKHIAWAYCHVPSGSTLDMTQRIEAQIERFAPGFADCIAARSTMNCADYAKYNPNLIGGDITGGMNHWSQLFTRPVARINPYTTPESDIYICSSSSPPGGGVHGMCGYWAAEAALRRAPATR